MFLLKRKEMLSVEDATSALYNQIAKNIGWKFLKSKKCFKKTIQDLVFEIQFHCSKWNESYKNVEVQCECQMWCKKFDKTLNVKSQVGYYEFVPKAGTWWNISDKNSLQRTAEQLCEQIQNIVIPLSECFERDFTMAAKHLLDDEIFELFHIRFEFIAFYAGKDFITEKAKVFYQALPETIHQQVKDYRKGSREQEWMLNPCNLKYIVDNHIV